MEILQDFDKIDFEFAFDIHNPDFAVALVNCWLHLQIDVSIRNIECLPNRSGFDKSIRLIQLATCLVTFITIFFFWQSAQEELLQKSSWSQKR